MQRRDFLGALGMLGSSTLATPAAAAPAYPGQSVRMIVGHPAGGGTDAVARLMGQKLGETLGQSFIVDNRGGAGGMIGAEAVAKAAPDGHTLLFASNPELTTSPWLQARPPYAAMTDFLPVALIAQSPMLLVAHAALPGATLREALKAARRAPAGLSIGTAGMGSSPHIAVEMLRAETGLDLVHVPYKGGAPITVAVLGGEVSFAVVGVPPLLAHIQAGRLRPMALLQARRSPLLPDVPTLGEALDVMHHEDFAAWYGMLLPARAPDTVARTLEKAALAALEQPAVRSRLVALGTDIVGIGRRPFAERMQAESRRYRDLIARFGITAG